MTDEEKRLREPRTDADWKTWGPYLSERAWGTVREDYSADGSAWTYFPHDHARSRAYRWNEDGLLGISDRRQNLCFALALWNGQDPILKERAFGLSGPEGNHGEDIKDYLYFLDSTPTHSYMKALYKYPQAAFPYEQLVQENRNRGRESPEYELLDTGIFNENRYFDVQIEYAKDSPNDNLIRITITNRGPDSAPIWLLPTLWFRNEWSWDPARSTRPTIRLANATTLEATHPDLGTYRLFFEPHPPRLRPRRNFHRKRIQLRQTLRHPQRQPLRQRCLPSLLHQQRSRRRQPRPLRHQKCHRLPPHHRSRQIRHPPPPPLLHRTNHNHISRAHRKPPRPRLRHPLHPAPSKKPTPSTPPSIPPGASDDLKNVQRQAFAGLMWSKQFFNYDVSVWLKGDPAFPPPPASRWSGRNCNWQHIANDSVMSMPDSWEYPWYAAWDLAFHTIPLALIDPDFAKRQLILLLREWYMHPSGQLPAYEWAFGDVNPPVHAWAALRVFRIERRMRGKGDRAFLERVFHKLLINFTWWINRKDKSGHNIFQGGFLGLDNIGAFDRSAPLPSGAYLDQSDGTAWMAMFCLNMLAIAIELAREDNAYEDVATKFLEHYFNIAHAMNNRPAVGNDDGIDLWDDDDGFYYDVMHKGNGEHFFLRVRSMVGLIPLLAVETIEEDTFQRLPDFAKRLEWFRQHRPELCGAIASVTTAGQSNRRLFSIVDKDRLRAILTRALDENEFLSPYGLRSVSRFHKDNPLRLDFDGTIHTLDYEPAESTTGLFGGNSNWRGPIWFPLNYLLIEALQKFDFYYGDSFTIECPTRSGIQKNLWDVSLDLSARLTNLFLRDNNGNRPLFGGLTKFQRDPHFKDLLSFPEYFHGDNGFGLGASHQTGWTALVAKLIQQRASHRATGKPRSPTK